MKDHHRKTKGNGLVLAARPLLLAAALVMLCATGLFAAQAAPAKQAAAPQYTAQQKEFMATLDKLIAEQNYPLFMQTITKADSNDLVNAALDWGKTRTLEGAGVVVPATYSALLWAMAEVDKSDATLRNTSSLMAMYAILVVAADGPKCADASAPERHMNNMLLQYQRQLDEVAALPTDQKRMAIEMAVNLERRIAPKRKNDKYLCRFGEQEQADIAKKGDSAAKQPTLDYTPQFRPREQWEPEQTTKRAAFSEFLNTLLKIAPAK
jgi:hypothetical protein